MSVFLLILEGTTLLAAAATNCSFCLNCEALWNDLARKKLLEIFEGITVTLESKKNVSLTKAFIVKWTATAFQQNWIDAVPMSTGAFISTVSVATGRSRVRGPGPGRVVVRWSDDIDSLASVCILLHHLFQPSLELYFSLSLLYTRLLALYLKFLSHFLSFNLPLFSTLPQDGF